MFRSLLVLATLIPIFSVSAAQITAHDPYIRATAPGVVNTAMFVRLRNEMTEPVQLVAVESDAAEVIELHTHSMDDGVMRMRKIDQIDIAAQAQAELKPGGDHVMLLNINQAMAEGDMVMMTLVFSDGSKLSLEVPVKMVMEHKH